MKKFFTFALVCCLVFSSSSIAFATPTQWDTSDRTLLSNIATTLTSTGTGTLLRSVNAILTALTSNTQQGSLYNGVAYLYDIRQYASQIASSLNGTNGSFLEKIFNALTHTDAAGIVYSYVTDIYQKVTEIDNTVLSMGSNISSIKTNTTNIPGIYAYSQSIDGRIDTYDNILVTNVPKIEDLQKGLTNYYLNKSASNPWTAAEYNLNAHRSFFGGLFGSSNQQGLYTIPYLNANGSTRNITHVWQYGSPIGNLALMLASLVQNSTFADSYLLTGFNNSQTYTNWTGSTLTTSTFNPTSATNGIYSWLSDIQTPIARLAFVHASDQEIEARQLAEDNQQAVVDNFIDPDGSGSLPTSSIGSVSDMSDSFKDNFSTDASPTGLFDIFNSDHGSWFSQETADQLDTTNINTRSLKAAPSDDFDTPLLDQQIDDIYDALGVKK